MQIVTISNRPDVALGTLDYIEALMPFIDHALIVCPAAQALSLERPQGRLAVTVIAEENLLGTRYQRFAESGDHQIKNWLLRSSLPRLATLDDEFLMADDDSRPLAEIPLELFEEAGRYHAYHTYDLARWTARETDYDAGQHQTRQILASRGYPTLSYSAHMPQIIHKDLLAEVVRELTEETKRGLAIDEWSAYFNIARARHPERFHPPRLYETLCWPALPTDWEAGTGPTRFLFENYYPPLYDPGGLFEGIPQRFHPQAGRQNATEKIKRRRAVQKVYDSFAARILRHAAWALRRAVLTGEARLDRAPALRAAARRLLPGPLRRWLRDAARRGDDPAWSFPSFMTRYSCRHPPP